MQHHLVVARRARSVELTGFRRRHQCRQAHRKSRAEALPPLVAVAVPPCRKMNGSD
jgi:hypothetical protein